MTLTDVTVVQAPDATKMNLDVHRELKILTENGEAIRAAEDANSQIGLTIGNEFYTFTGDPELSTNEREAQIHRTYLELKASQDDIASGNYEFSKANVVIRKPDGSGGWVDEVVKDRDLSSALSREGGNLKKAWENYEKSVSNPKEPVDVIPILDIDLSKFTSGASRAWCVYYIET